MKFLKNILLPVAALGMMSGCGELDKVTAPDPATAKAPVLTSVPTTVVITGENQKTESAVFQWTPADYGFPAAPTYSIMISVGGGAPVELTAAQGSKATVTYELLNARAIVAGAQVATPPAAPIANDVTFTIISTLTAGFGAPLTSASAAARITAYAPPPSYLWLAGNFDLVGWAPDSPLAPRLTSPTPGSAYEGMVDLNSASALEFKLCGQPNWGGPNYGGSKDALDPNGGNITDLPAGYYRMIVDNAVTKINADLKIETIGAIGNGVPGEWGSETKMTYDAQTNTWTIPSIPMTNGGEFKLRINDDWTYALGGALDNTSFTGGNIKVEGATGNYKMVFHAGEIPYRIELVKL
jgi:hypothetical protein